MASREVRSAVVDMVDGSMARGTNRFNDSISLLESRFHLMALLHVLAVLSPRAWWEDFVEAVFWTEAHQDEELIKPRLGAMYDCR